MKLNKTMASFALTLVMAAAAQAADMGHGTVSFTGSIIDAPCSISPENIDQTVDLGQVSNSALAKKGKTSPKFFSIRLDNCALTAEEGATAKSKVSVKFTGTSGMTDGMLGLVGTAQGASLALTDKSGNLIPLNSASAAQTIQDGENTLSFGAYLQGDGDAVVPGDFKSVANFMMDYK